MNDRKKLTMPKKGEKGIRILKRKHRTKNETFLRSISLLTLLTET